MHTADVEQQDRFRMINHYHMKIAYYMPFKPLGHPNPSGDLVFGTELYNHLNDAGNICTLVSRLRCRWIYLHPGKLLKLLFERHRVIQELRENPPDIWLSYHCYYKAPDLLGPYCARKLGIPYVIFQGIYSTKRRRKMKTMPGFYLNRRALTSAQLVITNKRRDELNLLRLLPRDRVCYIAPGIHSKTFQFNAQARETYRKKWNIEDQTVVMSAAMFRPGVKTAGLKIVMQSCAELLDQGKKIQLVIAGDGSCREELQKLGNELLGGNITFLGKVARDQLHGIYSGADIFAFPGIDESFGMVYTEAQSCGLPVVAYSDWGGSEAAVDHKTGLLSPAARPEQFTKNIGRLIDDISLRKKFGLQAAEHVRENHELNSTYAYLDNILQRLR